MRILSSSVGSSLAWTKKLLLGTALLAAAAIPAFGQTQSMQASTLWNKVPGNYPFFTTGTTMRSIAFNPVTGNLLLVSRQGSNGVHRVDGATGTLLTPSFNTTGITGGAGGFFIMAGAVADDGKIYVCNLVTTMANTAGGRLKVYRWNSENDATNGIAPTTIMDSNLGQTIGRYGDYMTARGSGVNTEILIGSQEAKVVLLNTTDGTNFTPTLISISGIGGAGSTTASKYGLTFAGPGTNAFYGKSFSGNGFYMSYNVGAGTGAALSGALAFGNSGTSSLGFDPARGLIGTVGRGGAGIYTNTHIFSVNPTRSLTVPGNMSTNVYNAATSDAGASGAAVWGNGRLYTLALNNILICYDVSPAILSAPTNQTLSALADPSFIVNAVGNGSLTYQWKRGGTNLVDGSHFSGSTTGTLTITDADGTDDSTYVCEVSNSPGGTSTTTFTLDVLDPGITTQPGSTNAPFGSTLTRFVVAEGQPTLTYQWKKDGIDIAGATGTSITFSPLLTNDAGIYTCAVTNGTGLGIISANSVIHVRPGITNQPSDQTVASGSTVNFAVGADGEGTVTYQWKKAGVNLADGGIVSGAQTPTLTLTGVTVADSANYTCALTNAFGNVTSSNATLTVLDAPAITVQPVSTNHNAGTTATFKVTATGGLLSYQWRKDEVDLVNGGNVSGATTPTLTLTGVLDADEGDYDVVVTNSVGFVISDPAALTVNDPFISSNPTNLTRDAGQSATFSITAVGTTPLVYQWFKDSSPLSDTTNITGSTTATLSINSVFTADSGSYTCNVTNANNNVAISSAATLTVGDPAITSQPVSQIVGSGTNVTLSVTVTGTPTITYQWRKGGVDLTDGGEISGATTPTLLISGPVPTNSGGYDVVVTGITTVTSVVATVTVVDPPVITVPPLSVTNIAGTTASFSVTVTGGSLVYQWRSNGVDLANGGKVSGATTATLNISNVQVTEEANYSVFVTNAAGTATSSDASLTVHYTLTISATGLGTAAPDVVASSYAPSTGVNVTATPAANFAFSHWTGSYGGSANPLAIVMTSNITLVARFTSSVPDIIIDNDNANNTGGSSASFIPVGWQTGTSSGDKFLNDYRFFSVSATGTNTATFTPNIITPGNYDVYEWHPIGGNRSVQAPWTVVHSGGPASTTINQTINGGSWRLLFTGKFFLAGTSGYVRLSNQTPETAKVVMADGIRLVYSTNAQDSAVVVTDQPDSVLVGRGTNAVFSVAATGTGPLVYQWQKNGTNLTDGDNISGATTTTLTVASANDPDVAAYTVVITNVAGAVVSSAAQLDLDPNIVTQPANLNIGIGTNAVFTVGATGNGLTYRWRKGGIPMNNGVGISGVTTPTLTLTTPAVGISTYSVVVSNSIGVLISSNATLWVQAKLLTASIMPMGPVIKTNGNHNILTGKSTGGLGAQFQWLFNDVAIPGATNITFIQNPITLADTGLYKVIAMNAANAVTSAAVTVNVFADAENPKPTAVKPKPLGIYTNVTDGTLDVFPISGTIKDNGRVTNVTVSINGGAPQTMTLNPPQGSNSVSWSGSVAVLPGTNTFSASVTDYSGNTTNTPPFNFFFHVGSTFTLLSNSEPATAAPLVTFVTPGAPPLNAPANGASLQVGRTYKITATPLQAPFYILTNWTATWDGQPTPVVLQTNNAIINFMMRSNLVLTANYITNPLIKLQGTYDGLFYESGGVSHHSSGYAQFKVTPKFSASGKFYMDGDAVAVAIKVIKIDGTFKVFVPRNKVAKPDLWVEGSLDFAGGSDTLNATVAEVVGGTTTNWIADLVTDRRYWSTNVGGIDASAYTNAYTMILQSFTNNADGPVGYSAFTMSVDKLGVATTIGNASDNYNKGAIFPVKAPVNKNGILPFYGTLYPMPDKVVTNADLTLKTLTQPQGSMLGWLTFAANTNAFLGNTNLAPQGQLSWIKRQWTNQAYTAGFTSQVEIASSRHHMFATTERIYNFTNAYVAAIGDDLLGPFTNIVNLKTNNAFVPQLIGLTNKFAAALTAKSGLLKGSFTNAVFAPTVKISWMGVMLQDYNYGRGFFMTTNGVNGLSGQILLDPVP